MEPQEKAQTLVEITRGGWKDYDAFMANLPHLTACVKNLVDDIPLLKQIRHVTDCSLADARLVLMQLRKWHIEEV